jgi:hypothetical protein
MPDTLIEYLPFGRVRFTRTFYVLFVIAVLVLLAVIGVEPHDA